MKRLSSLLVAIALTACAVVGTGKASSLAPPQPDGTSVLYGQVAIFATVTSGSVQLPSTALTAQSITIFNGGTADVYVRQGDSTVVATTSDILIKSGTSISMWVTGTYVAAITGSSTANVVIYQGNGPVNFAGGGGSGSGGGGAITAAAGAFADGAITTQGSVGDSPWSGSGSGSEIAIDKYTAQQIAASMVSDNTSDSGIKGNPLSIDTHTNCGAVGLSNATINKMEGDALGNLCDRTLPQLQSYIAGYTAVANTSTLLVAATASKSYWSMNFHCNNTSASSVNITVQDGSGGTTLDTVVVPAGSGNNPGQSEFPDYKTTAGNGLYVQASASISSVYCRSSGIFQ